MLNSNSYMFSSELPDPSNPPQSGGFKGTGVVALAAIAAPFVGTALASRMIYKIPLASTSNLIITGGMLAGNMIPVPFAGVATGIAAGTYFAGLPTMESVVIVAAGTALTIALDLTVVAWFLRENIPK